MAQDRSSDRHAERRRAFQLSDRRWQQFDDAAKASGSNRAAVTTGLVLWWLGVRPEPPPRPPQDPR